MDLVLSSTYIIVLSLWVGGMAITTFIFTPVIFKAYSLDTSGDIVGHLFPPYFRFNLILSVIALTLYPVLADPSTGWPYFLSLLLLVTALLLNISSAYYIHPRIKAIKKEIKSFESASQASPARKQFRKYHAASAMLNLTILVEGVILLILSQLSR